MEDFSRHNHVLYVESPGLRRPALQKKDGLRIWRRLLKWFKGARCINQNLHIYSPLLIPFHRYGFIRKLNKFLLKLQIDSAVRKLKMKDPIFWSYVPTAIDFLHRYGEKLSVYHCVDEYAANPLIPEVIRDIEKQFLKRVNIVFVTSEALYESKLPYNKKTHYLPNVADFNHFNRAVTDALPEPEEIAEIPHPRIGYIGALSDYKLDFPMLSNLAEKFSDCSFVFIGPLGEGEKAADLSILARHDNVHIFDRRPYEKLPDYIKYIDVFLFPHRLNEYTRNMFPMKFFELLSAGKPLVSVDLYSLRRYSDFFYISRDNDEFENNLNQALKEPPVFCDNSTQSDNKDDFSDNTKQSLELSDCTSARIAVAREHTWEKRREKMIKIIKKEL